MMRFRAILWLLLLVIAATAHGGPAANPAPEVQSSTHPTGALPRLRIVAGLTEPLVATGPTSPQDDGALDAAIARFGNPASPPRDFVDSAKPLTAFLEAHPASAWRMAVLANLGLGYYRSGYFTKATAAWEQAWQAGRDATTPQAKALADRAIGELARMHARLGHAGALERLFAQIADRPLSGPATELVAGAQEGLWSFRNEPEVSYLCGPMALKSLLVSQKAQASKIAVMDAARSGPRGFSLAQVSDLAAKAGVPHQLVYRAPGQPIPVPSVVNWKLHHYAAIVAEKDGLYHVQDPTFGSGDAWLTKEAIDEEASGYFLVPRQGMRSGAWRSASAAEAQMVYGMGRTAISLAGSTMPTDKSAKGSCGGMGMCVADAKLMLVSLNLNDTPVGYRPPRGPAVTIRLTYNQREAEQPANFGFFNVSPKWSLNMLSWIEDNPAVPGNNVTRHAAGGGSVDYPNTYNPATGLFPAERQTQAVLARSPASGAGPATYELRMPDGSKQVFSKSDGATVAPRRILLTQIVDPAGNALTLNYDGQLRLTSITDASGRNTTFDYAAATSPLLITKITDPFGRHADLQYDGAGRLAAITDVIGITSSFTYDAGGLINAMTTPYGTSTFTYGQNTAANSRFLEMTDPMGATERVEFLHQAPGVADRDTQAPAGVANIYLDYRNTFYWDKYAFQVARGNYLQARRTHWLHTPQSQTSPIVESVKMPLESRVWMTYPGQTLTYFEGTVATPVSTRRVLDDGSTQLSSYTYNGTANLTSATDPVGRKTSLSYASNGIDVFAAQQQAAAGGAATVASFTYNSQHLPVSSTDAAGQTSTYSYNTAGQVTSATDALGKTTGYVYDDVGRLTRVMNASGAAQLSLSYDGFDRVASSTGSEGYTQTYAYDALDRVTQIGYPDGTTTQYTYDKLDRVTAKDRMGRVTRFAYDANRRLVSVTDPMGQTTGYAYYANGTLRSLTDPNGNVTSWDIDVQSRPVAKRYADGTTETYAYESAGGRLKSVTDALGQTKAMTYTADDRVASLTYANARIPTPGVSYTYDPAFPRVATMTDGIGTTTYAYNPVGGIGGNQLAVVTSPVAGQPSLSDVVAYTYDGLGRVVARSVDGVVEKRGYDALDRTAVVENALGTFNYTYVGSSSRVAGIAASNGPQVAMGYFGPSGDEMLKRIAYTTATGAPLATYAYTYDSNNNVTTFTDALAGKTLTAAATGTGTSGNLPVPPTMTAQGGATAPPSGSAGPTVAVLTVVVASLLGMISWLSGKTVWRRRSLRIAAPLVAFGLMASCGGGGSAGGGGLPGTGGTGGSSTGTPPTSDATARITTYNYDGRDRLVAASVAPDTSALAPTATYAYGYDKASNLISTNTSGIVQSLTVNATNALASGTYDANGNPLSLSSAAYTWDGSNRIISSNVNGNDSMFFYDGKSRLVRIIDRQSGTVVADKSYLWCNLNRCAERDNTKAGSPVTRHYLSQGTVIADAKYFYLTDRLGTVRQALNVALTPATQYEYDPYGMRSKTNGNLELDNGFSQLFHHSNSGLDLATFRAYDSKHSRWLSRDPIAEYGGANLYSYVNGNPTSYVDGSGLYGFGVSLGAQIDAGVDLAGGGATGSAGIGYFFQHFNPFSNPSIDGFASGGAFAGGPGTHVGALMGGPGWGVAAPACPSDQNSSLGAYAGGGLGLFLTNADNANDLSGPFETTSFNLGWGPVNFSVQLSNGQNSDGKNIWQFTYGGPLGFPSGLGYGLSVSHYNTYTVTTRSGAK